MDVRVAQPLGALHGVVEALERRVEIVGAEVHIANGDVDPRGGFPVERAVGQQAQCGDVLLFAGVEVALFYKCIALAAERGELFMERLWEF